MFLCSVGIFGEDVAFGGVFRCTVGLRKKYGEFLGTYMCSTLWNAVNAVILECCLHTIFPQFIDCARAIILTHYESAHTNRAQTN